MFLASQNGRWLAHWVLEPIPLRWWREEGQYLPFSLQ